MKKIPLTQNIFALVDDCDFDMLSKYKWYARRDGNTFYAIHAYWEDGRDKSLYMHRVILKAKKGQLVDHANFNGLDNRRSNIRLCNTMQNLVNRITFNKATGYRGVTISGKKYSADICVNKVRFYLGRFDTREEAAIAYNEAAKKYFGEFAQLNKV